MKLKNILLLTTVITLLNLQPVWAEKISVKVNGFVCSLCAQGVEKKLIKATKNNIKNYSVDMDTKIVSFELKKGIKLNDEDLTKAITKAGYAVESIQRSGDEAKVKPVVLTNEKDLDLNNYTLSNDKPKHKNHDYGKKHDHHNPK